jgi:hypothetical protein
MHTHCSSSKAKSQKEGLILAAAAAAALRGLKEQQQQQQQQLVVVLGRQLLRLLACPTKWRMCRGQLHRWVTQLQGENANRISKGYVHERVSGMREA